MADKTYVGDTGTVIILDCGSDITASTVRTIEAQRPDLTTVSWPASIVAPNSISFTTLVGSLNAAGKWKLQARVTLPTGEWRGGTASFVVYLPFK